MVDGEEGKNTGEVELAGISGQLNEDYVISKAPGCPGVRADKWSLRIRLPSQVASQVQATGPFKRVNTGQKDWLLLGDGLLRFLSSWGGG